MICILKQILERLDDTMERRWHECTVKLRY